MIGDSWATGTPAPVGGFSVVGPTGWYRARGYGDILRCHLSNGHCNLVAHGHGLVRLAANGDISG